MARLRYNGLSTTLGGSLTSSGTSVTFAAALTHSGGTAVPTIAGSDFIPLSILDSTGRLSEVVYLTAYTSGATTGTIGRGKEGTTGVAHSSGDKVTHGPLVEDVGVLLASMSYNPASFVQTVVGTTEADLDATNLKITFTAPSSGIVLVKVGILSIGAASVDQSLTLRNGSTRVAGPIRVSLGNVQAWVAPTFRLTGLTAGTSYTLKLGALAGNTGTQVGYGGTSGAQLGAFTMDAWSA